MLFRSAQIWWCSDVVVLRCGGAQMCRSAALPGQARPRLRPTNTHTHTRINLCSNPRCPTVCGPHLTDMENSPGALSLSLTRKAPHSLCLRRPSATPLDTRPANQLHRDRGQGVNTHTGTHKHTRTATRTHHICFVHHTS